MIQHHVKVVHIPPGYGTYLSFNEKMIARSPIVNAKWNLKITQETLDRAYLSHQVDTIKIDNPMLYQSLFNVFTDIDNYFLVKQRKAMQDCIAVYFDNH